MILICYHYLSYVPGGSQKPSRSGRLSSVTADELIVLILLLRLGGRRELDRRHKVLYSKVNKLKWTSCSADDQSATRTINLGPRSWILNFFICRVKLWLVYFPAWVFSSTARTAFAVLWSFIDKCINPIYGTTHRPSFRYQTFIESREHFLSKNAFVNNALHRWYLAPQKPGVINRQGIWGAKYHRRRALGTYAFLERICSLDSIKFWYLKLGRCVVP